MNWLATGFFSEKFDDFLGFSQNFPVIEMLLSEPEVVGSPKKPRKLEFEIESEFSNQVQLSLITSVTNHDHHLGPSTCSITLTVSPAAARDLSAFNSDANAMVLFKSLYRNMHDAFPYKHRVVD